MKSEHRGIKNIPYIFPIYPGVGGTGEASRSVVKQVLTRAALEALADFLQWQSCLRLFWQTVACKVSEEETGSRMLVDPKVVGR